jgi:BolA protein
MPLSREVTITTCLNNAFDINHLEVVNESHRHHVPENAETHFKVTVVSDTFQNTPLIKRHRQINALLQEEFDNGLHALSIHAYTPTEWQKRQAKTKDSPSCRDGFDK